jgi:hypothetical protein
MKKYYSIKPHSVPSVQHYLIRFDSATNKFFHRVTGEEIRVSSHDVNKDYAGWFLLTSTVSLVDGTTVDSSQLYCNINTGACFNRTTEQPVQLQPNQVHFVVIDHQNPREIDYISRLIHTEIANNHKKQVRAKQVRKEGWNLFYCVENENEKIHSFNFDELILSKVVIVPDGDNYFFYSMRSPTYNAFGSTILFQLV